MNHQLAALQDCETVNAQTARQFHLNSIDHLQKALAFHRNAIGSHDKGDLVSAAENTKLARAQAEQAIAHTASAAKHY